MKAEEGISTRVLDDGPDPFEVMVLEAAAASRVVLFSVGAGGDPKRHLPLLQSLAGRGCTVVAPRFERLTSTTPTAGDLLLRARRLHLALDSIGRPGLPAVGVGHSIGAAMLLVLVGAQAWTRAGELVCMERLAPISHLALLAPATDFFRPPGALDGVRTPITVWAGTEDRITPPAQAEFLKAALGRLAELHLADGAGHFSFMDEPPPQTLEPLVDRQAFLGALHGEIGRAVRA